MAEFLILRGAPTAPVSWIPTAIVSDEPTADLSEVVKEGFVYPGRYRIVRWDNGSEFDLAPGSIEAVDPAP